MKKILLVLNLLLFFLLDACTPTPSYEDIFQEYDGYLLSNQLHYQEKINYINHLSTEVIRGVVKVKKISSNQSTVSYGSGIIFYDDVLYYYILTNQHVVEDINIHDSIYIIYDFLNQSYQATYLIGSNDYDLSVLRVRKGTTVLNSITFAKQDLNINQEVVTLGYPQSQSNAINIGVLLDYGPIDVDSSTANINIDFNVMIADVPLRSGSSGSGAINEAFELVGIVFAGNFSHNSTLSDYSFMIPISVVKNYLLTNRIPYREASS